MSLQSHGASADNSRKALVPIPVSISVLRAVYLVAAFIAVAPLFTVEIAPLVDYPNHIARMFVLAHSEEVGTSAHYATSWRPIPNLAIDLVVPPLARVMGLYEAGRLFLALSLLALAAGICALHRVAHGSLGLWPLMSFLLLYNLPFAWGFVNFYLSTGLALLLFAAWLAVRQSPPRGSLVLFNLGVAGLYFTHLFGVAVYGVCVAVTTLQHMLSAGDWRVRSLLRQAVPAAGQFGLAAAIYASLHLFWNDEVAPLKLGTWAGDFVSKVAALVSGFLFIGHWSELASLALVIAVLLVAATRRRLAVGQALRWPLVAFLVLTLAAPTVLRGIFVDGRLGVVFGCLLIAACRPTLRSSVYAYGFVAVVLFLCTVKSLAIAGVWRERSADYTEFQTALTCLPKGSRLLSVHDYRGASDSLSYDVRWHMSAIVLNPALARSYSYRNLPALAVAERDAFVPLLFTFPVTQPIEAVAALRDIDAIQPARRLTPAHLLAATDDARRAVLSEVAAQHGEHLFWIDWPNDFDFIIVFHDGGTPIAALPQGLAHVATGSFFDIFQVVREGSAIEPCHRPASS